MIWEWRPFYLDSRAFYPINLPNYTLMPSLCIWGKVNYKIYENTGGLRVPLFSKILIFCSWDPVLLTPVFESFTEFYLTLKANGPADLIVLSAASRGWNLLTPCSKNFKHLMRIIKVKFYHLVRFFGWT